MGLARSIDDAVLSALWRADVTTRDIANRFAVSPTTVIRRADALGLPARHQGWGGARPVAAAPVCVAPAGAATAAADAPDPATDLAGALARDGGTHAGRAAIAARFGLSLARVQQEWHRARARAVVPAPPAAPLVPLAQALPRPGVDGSRMGLLQGKVLIALEGGPLTSNGLADRLGSSQSALWAVLRRLCDRGLILREVDPAASGIASRRQIYTLVRR